MLPSLPCPTPGCTHTFPAEALQGVAQLACPRCGQVFSVADDSPPTALEFNSSPGAVVKPRARRRQPFRLLPWLAVAAVVALGIVVALWGRVWQKHFQKIEAVEKASEKGDNTYNARFERPGAPWEMDEDIRLKLHVHIGMRSPDDNYMGLAFRDYQRRRPSDAELLDEALGKLRGYFQNLEWERKPKDADAHLAGRPALAIEFQGQSGERVPMNGECYMLTSRGYGYWFFTWAPLQDKEALSPQWSELRQRLQLLNGRKGWKEKPRETEEVEGTKVKYQLAFVKEVWTRAVAEHYDEAADLALQGAKPNAGHRPLAREMASFQVLVLPKCENLQAASAAARAYLQKREDKEYPMTAFETLKDKNGVLDRDADIGDGHGRLSKFRVRNSEDRHRFLVVAVLNRPEGVLVLIGDCLWPRRDFWDQEFVPLFDSLKVQ